MVKGARSHTKDDWSASTARSDLPLLVHNRRLEGTLSSALLKGDLLIAAAQAP